MKERQIHSSVIKPKIHLDIAPFDIQVEDLELKQQQLQKQNQQQQIQMDNLQQTNDRLKMLVRRSLRCHFCALFLFMHRQDLKHHYSAVKFGLIYRNRGFSSLNLT